MSTLKPRHSLVGKSLLPVILELKALGDKELAVRELARLKKDHCLTEYSLEDLVKHFEGLTGELVKDVLPLTGKSLTLESMRSLLSFAILQANTVGAPKGQPIKETGKGSDNGVTDPNLDQNVVVVHDTEPSTSGSVEGRLMEMEKRMEKMVNKSAEEQVEECLRHVRILASRPSLIQSHVLIAALETLVGVAMKLNHKDADYFSKSLVFCKKYENAQDLCGLTMKLFGSAEDKKISSVVAEWVKGKKYEEKPDKAKEPENPKGGQNFMGNMMFPPPQPFPNYGYQPQFPMYPYPSFGNGYRFNRWNGGSNRGRRASRPRCFFCKNFGHLVADCPELKKD